MALRFKDYTFHVSGHELKIVIQGIVSSMMREIEMSWLGKVLSFHSLLKFLRFALTPWGSLTPKGSNYFNDIFLAGAFLEDFLEEKFDQNSNS